MASSFWTGGPHPTSGLEGYPARDYGAPGGTPVYAWAPLKVVRLSGQSGYRGGGFGGINVYLQDRAGKSYFMTHVENVSVKAGTVLQPGQRIAEVGNYGSPHVHLGYTGGDPSTTLGIRPEYLFTPGGAVAGSKAVGERTGKGGRDIYDIPGVARGPGGIPIVPGPLPILEGGVAVGKRLPVVGGLFDAYGNAVDAISEPYKALRWVFDNWDRVFEVVGGFIFLLVGLILLGSKLGITPKRVPGPAGAALALASYGPSVEQAAPAPTRAVRIHEVTDAGERAAARRARYDPSTAEIPY